MSEASRIRCALTLHLDLADPGDGSLPRQCHPDAWRWDKILDLADGDRVECIEIHLAGAAQIAAAAQELYDALKLRSDHDTMAPAEFTVAHPGVNSAEQVTAVTRAALEVAERGGASPRQCAETPV